MRQKLRAALVAGFILGTLSPAVRAAKAEEGDELPKEKWSWIAPGVCIPWCEWGANCGCDD